MNDFWEQLDPGFFEPIWLLVGVFAVIAVILLEAGGYRRRRQALRLFAASHLIADLTRSVSPTRRLLKQTLLVIAVGFLFIALARPHLYYEWREENRTGLDTLLAVDCSKSMLSEDVKPNRLERAKLAISDFAEHLPDNRMGLIAFAGDAFLQCPLTIDHDAFLNAVRELDTDTIPRPGTDIATAIDEAVLASKSQSNNLKLLILVTDGEDLEGRVIDAAKRAAQSGLKIYTVGVGTANGKPIPERDDSGAIAYLRDSSGQLVQSKLDEPTLRQIASITGGDYEPLGQNGEGLEQIYDRYIAPLPKEKLEERREKVRFERYEWPLAISILFLTWAFLIKERARDPLTEKFPSNETRRPVQRPKRKTALVAAPLLVGAFYLAASFSTAQAASTEKAERDYKSGEYQDAVQNYKQAVEQEPNRSDLHYNLGDAAYKAGEYTEAEDAFRKTLETPDLGLQENTYYNLGNTQFKHGEAMEKADSKKTIGLWEQALHSYESSLKLKNSADAKHNYEVVKKKLEQLKQQQQNQQQNNQGQQSPSKDDQANKNASSKSGQSQDKQPQDPNNPQNKDQGSQPSENKDRRDQEPKKPDPDKNEPPSSSADDPNKTQARAHSEEREQDEKDPGAKSKEEAEALLDSLKDDERHITARTLNENNEPPPPPPSGKDW